MTRDRQVEKFMDINKKMIERAKPGRDRDYQLAMCAGFLAGVRMTNAITNQQYHAHYRELMDFAKRLEAAQTGEKDAHDIRVAV